MTSTERGGRAAGREYEIPFSDWYITQGSDSDQSCVQRMPGGMPMVLVGDVLFRKYVVMFDLTSFPGLLPNPKPETLLNSASR